MAVSLGVLTYASWRDYKTREVSNRVWVVYAPIALAITLIQLLFFEPSQLPLYGLSFVVTVGLAFLLFYAGGFGGADSKALMCIALALPFAPLALFTPILTGGVSPISQLIFPITIFSNSVLFAAASGFYMIIRNVVWHKKNGAKMFVGTLADESFGKKLLVLITGYKMSIAKLQQKWHVFPMEDIEADGKRKLVVIPRDEGREKIVDRLSNAVQAGTIDRYVWATPGLPMLIFVTLGLIVALFFGDIVWMLVQLILA
ncbi:MAG: prepilin peptidase [Candidatus Bathyarchaeota archaeon]|nr:prepilin peptidase [Candidatus Bathyarchaeota archaeon]